MTTDESTHSRRDERAVSPVIGVILMVAITVILAAVIGVFVLGLGDQVQETPPNTQFDAEWVEEDGEWNITITHVSGDTIEADNLRLAGEGIDEDDGVFSNGDGDVWTDDSWGDEIRAGDSATTENIESEENTYRIVWESGGTSSTVKTIDPA